MHPLVPDLTYLFVTIQTVEAIDSERDILQADLDGKAEMVANLTEELELGHQQADDANRYSLLTCSSAGCVYSCVRLLFAVKPVVMILFQQHDECMKHSCFVHYPHIWNHAQWSCWECLHALSLNCAM